MTYAVVATLDEGGFFGRADDLEQLASLLAHDGAFVTIVGPPGVGKTRLANELVRSFGLIDHLLCEVSELRTADALLARLAELLHVGTGTSTSLIERVGDALAEYGELLLVVDNVEQLIEAATPTLRALRQVAPRVRWLLTSREPLGLLGERRHEVTPLGIEPGTAGESEAARMLADRVTRARGAEPSAGEREILARIGVRLDGLPLALELAASRIATIGATAVEARLAQQLAVLTYGPRDLEHRQRTLRRAIAWSWDLLAASEQRALAQLSVFRGGFDLGAAEVVVDAGAESALDLIQMLRQKSLLYMRLDDAGDVRLGLYLSIREFAAGELGPGDADAARRRHADHYADFIARTRDLNRLLADRDNIFAAIERCIEIASADSIPTAARLLLGLAPLIDRTPLEPYLERLEALLAMTPSAELLSADLRCGVQATAARCMRRLGRLGDAKRIYADALALARAINATAHQARLHAELGMVAFHETRIADARAQWETSMAIARELGDDRQFAIGQTRCGMILRESNRLFEARTILVDALATHRRANDDDGIVITLAELAQIHLELGELADCHRLLDEAARRPIERRSLLSEAAILARTAFVCWERGDHEPGATLAQRALVHLSQIGYRRIQAGLVSYLAIAQLLVGADPSEQLVLARSYFGADARGNHLCGAWLGHLSLCTRDPARASELFSALPVLSDGDPFTVASAILRLPLVTVDPAELAHRAAALGDAVLASTSRSARTSSFDVRLALRAIERFSNPRSSSRDAVALEVRADGSELTFDAGPQSLARYRRLRRLLIKLVETRLASPATPLAWDALFAVGWPGERIHVEAARNRVKVAISSLRAMGLRDVLLHDGTGYLIDPALRVRVVTR